MALDKSFNTLGDLLLKRYVEDFVSSIHNGKGLMSQFFEDQIDLERVLNEAEKVSFEDLLK